jgi:single-strand selective monofunctional uracil DNA glycosylase
MRLKALVSQMNLFDITDELIKELGTLTFGPPVTHVYNPLVYARKAYDVYLRRYATLPKEIVLVGMNPGPWGMAQSGVPFGEIDAVKNWLQIETAVGTPRDMHPKRPVTGFACTKSEVSGKRLWGWARKFFGTPDNFFKRFFVANYCPLLFLESSGRNRTPPSLRMAARKPLLDVCDRALRRTVTYLNPRYVIGVGTFARDRAMEALAGMELIIGGMTHPSPANPKANRGWEEAIGKELAAIGITFKSAER